MSSITSLYFSDIVVLLLGANIISATWEITRLDRRLALLSLLFLGPSLKLHIAVWFLVSVTLSSVLPNAVVCALMTPICIAMLRFLGAAGQSIPRNVGYILLLAIVWGCGLGGLGTPLGGAMNLVAVSYLEKVLGREYFYMEWIAKMLPMMGILVTCALAFLLYARPRDFNLGKSTEFIATEYAKLPRFSREELISLVLFVAPLVLSFARELYAVWLPGLKPAHLYLLSGIIAFVLSGRTTDAFTNWKTVGPKIEWQLLLLFAGGLALGQLLTTTGTTRAVASWIAAMHLGGGFLTLLVIAAITILFVEVASNTAAAAIVVPMVIGLAQELGLDPVAFIYVAAAAFNTGFMFPTAIRAIPVAYGLNTGYLFRKGVVMNVLTIIIVALAGQLLYF